MSDHISCRHGATAPSSSERFGSAISVDSSTLRTTPVPPQVGHAPPLLKASTLGTQAMELRAADGAHKRALGGHVQAGRYAMPVGALVAGQAREHEAKVVQKLGGRTERGMHVGDAGPLPQRDCRRHVQHLVHLRARGLADAPARIGGKRLQIAPRAFRVQHAKCQRALPRPRHSGDAHEAVQRHVDVHVLQVVHARPSHLDGARFDVVGVE